jgi:hypothetical protein
VTGSLPINAVDFYINGHWTCDIALIATNAYGLIGNEFLSGEFPENSQKRAERTIIAISSARKQRSRKTSSSIIRAQIFVILQLTDRRVVFLNTVTPNNKRIQ